VDIKTQGDVGYEVEGKITGTKKTKVTYLFNNYHYTMFVPTNEAMKEAYDKYHLPTVEQIRQAELAEEGDEELAEQQIPQKMREVVLDFIKYHIVDNASFVDLVGNDSKSVASESQKTELIFATYVEDDSTKFEIKHISEGVDSAYLAVPKVNSGKSAWYLVKSTPTVDAEGHPTSVEVYTTQYTSGKPFKVKIDVSESGMTLTDNIGEKAQVDMHDGLHNLVATEYWISNAISSKNSTGLMKSTSDPTLFFLNTSSSVVLHAINHPLVYADGKHKNQNGDIVPTQFEYMYKPLSSEVRTRK
ncbi:MAG: fasciclin domain-containing protein, partial [Bacteroidaceae bacterium]|nr:fasciclin domain-containing protein [Bacteroidaceae bacterium]